MCKQLFYHEKSTWACKQHVQDTSVQAIILAGEKHIDVYQKKKKKTHRHASSYLL